MSTVLNLVGDRESSEFYPTPETLVERMLQTVDLDRCRTILEPSAGKGDILRVIARKSAVRWGRYNRQSFDVDCIELDPNLRQILKYNFSAERESSLQRRIRELETKSYDRKKGGYSYTPEEKEEVAALNHELLHFFRDGIHIVHDDFLTYQPYKQYDLIVMNPPFSNGDKHLLKALKMQENGGQVVCFLNAETLKNPCTEARRELLRKLNELEAKVDFIDGAFSNAERRTGVEVAVISVTIPQAKTESDIYRHFKKAAEVEDVYSTCTELEVTDYIQAAINMYNVEVRSGLELIKQYRALVPYMLKDLSYDNSGPILRLTDSNDRGYNSVSANEYLKAVRLKYWKALLANPKFTGQLTSKLQEEYRKRVQALQDYDFTEYNIKTLSLEMGSRVKKGIEDEIIKMFDRLTEEHSYYPEFSKNIHLFNGWKTNKAHKIGKKVIIPCYGVYDSYDGRPRTYDAYRCLEDIERILNFLDGGMTQAVDAQEVIDRHFKEGTTKNIPLKYYDATFYKKGTVHLVFRCPELIDRFNIYAAQQKKWLPPTYGKKRYQDMDSEERAVVDSFQGKQAYEEVMARANYFLAPVTSGQMLMLSE